MAARARNPPVDLDDLEPGELPRGFFKSEAIKGRYDPAIEARRIPEFRRDEGG